MSIERKEVFKVLVAIYGSAIIIYYSYYPHELVNFSINTLLKSLILFILILIISSILYFIPSIILEYWKKRKHKLIKK